MGLISTGDCHRADAILGRIQRLHRVVDGMLAETDNVATAYSVAKALLNTYREHRITLDETSFSSR